jgi:aminopeptidase N
MSRAVLFALALLMPLSTSKSPVDAPEPGVPLSLAAARAARVSDVRYELHFTVPEALDRPVTGSARIHFTLTEASLPLALDFAGPAERVQAVRANGEPIPADVRNEHLLVPASALRNGHNELAVTFEASDLPLNRSPEFMYTLFVPARARFAFPCFDQPDLKARYTLTLNVPREWKALGNGGILSRTEHADRAQVVFAETLPISTYLFAFAAGRFVEETAERNERQFRMLHRETDPQRVARNRDVIFDLHASALEWLERYTNIPYPFGTFDFLLIPAFQFSGMEHPGAVYYNAPALLLDPSATQNQELGRASLIAHETAHMWFGDLVTMPWFDDVWMKEVFANFMAAKIVNPSFPDIDHDLRFLLTHYPAAYDVDRTAGTNPIRQRLENLNDAGSLYGAIIYQKAPVVMRQLETIATEDGLRDGLREYLTRYAFGNASWPDLIRILDARIPDDLAAWSRAWVEEAGRPVITTTGVHVEDGTVRIEMQQDDPLHDRDLTWAQRLQIAVGLSDRLTIVEGRMTGAELAVSLPLDGSPAPSFVLPNGKGIAYGEFVLDPASRTFLLRHLPDLPDALTRGAALVTLWEEMLSGRIRADEMFDLLAGALPQEREELNLQRMLTYAQHAYWTFLRLDERDRRTPAFEQVLREGLDAARTQSVKAAWFSTLRDTARTPQTLEWLEAVWDQRVVVPGLTLAEPDFIRLALELAVREVPRTPQILEQQRARIENPDRLAQFAFVIPALSADPGVRRTFFESLRDVRNRRQEAWVLQAVSYLHHPLRASSSEPLIRPSLELLADIQQTGDIFFPKRWMDATLGGHQSPSAARIVRSFVDDMSPDYPERLRRIVLSSADTLFRASRRTGP